MNSHSFEKIAKMTEKSLAIARMYGKQIRKEDEGMKTWEMIKELTENPEKEFISKRIEGPVGGFKALNTRLSNNNNILLLEDDQGNTLYSIALDRDWEEAKEPISFTEALEVVKKDMSTKITIKNKDHNINRENMYLGEILNILGHVNTGNVIAEILLESDFYIED